MIQYNCKFQVYVSRGEYWNGCMTCTADAINNPKCPNYVPVNFRVLRTLRVVGLEEKVERK